MRTTKRVPRAIDGTPVRRISQETPMMVRGQRWVSLAPVDEEDNRLWEFSLDTGRVLATGVGE